MSSYLLMDGDAVVKRVDVTHERYRPAKEESQTWVEVPAPARDYDALRQPDGTYQYHPRLSRLKEKARGRIEKMAREASAEMGIDRALADEAIRLAAEINAGKDPAADDYPLIKAEAEERGLNRQEAINAVLQWVSDRKARLAEIHRRRIRAEKAIEAATTEEEINQAMENL